MIELHLRRSRGAVAAAETAGGAQKTERHERAFRTLQTAHGERLRLFCLRLCAGSPDDAADLTQETWLAAYEGLPRFQNRAKVTTWLFRIALYRWRQTRGAAGESRPVSLNVAGDAANSLSTPDAAPSTLDRLALADALLLLSDPQREAFLLVKAEQFTHREAAAILQIPQGTVQARVHEAVRHLRVLLTETDLDHTTAAEETNVVH